ncbi:hypothetical protein L917_12528, partial [Phytophthora nicotianae]
MVHRRCTLSQVSRHIQLGGCKYMYHQQLKSSTWS